MDDSGCPFWYWEEDYVKILETKGILTGSGGRMVAEASGTDVARNGLPVEGSVIGQDVVILLKYMCFVCTCMLFVMVLNLFVVLMK